MEQNRESKEYLSKNDTKWKVSNEYDDIIGFVVTKVDEKTLIRLKKSVDINLSRW